MEKSEDKNPQPKERPPFEGPWAYVGMEPHPAGGFVPTWVPEIEYEEYIRRNNHEV